MIVNWISRVMGERRWNISDLARGAGISRSTATKLYYGGTDVNLSIVDRVCKALDADLCELFEYLPDGDGDTHEGGEAEVREATTAGSR